MCYSKIFHFSFCSSSDYVEDRAKWMALRASGLFKNLTSQMIPQKCIHQARLVISGEELPSIRFSPEFSIGSSLANPDVEGGVSFMALYCTHFSHDCIR